MPAYAAAAATTQLATKLADAQEAPEGDHFLAGVDVEVKEITFAPAMAEEWPADEPDAGDM